MMNVLLSVILPTFDPADYLFAAIESVRTQVGLAVDTLEIIVVDDASQNKNSLMILGKAAEIDCVTVMSLSENAGPSHARNVGIDHARGAFIGFIDDDDLWPPNKWETQSKHFSKQPDLDLVSGQIHYFMDGDVKDPIENYHRDGNILYHVHLGACLMRSSLFEDGAFRFDEALRLSEDWDWWLQIKERGVKHVILDEPTLEYRVHANNTSIQLNIRELGLLKVLKSSLDRRRAMGGREILSPHRGESDAYAVSVVMSLYNGVKFLQRALDSIMKQTYPIEEVIVVDDGSIDDGADLVVRKYPNVTLVKQVNAGVANARNTGWKMASTVWIALMDQDDEWLPNKIERQIDKAKENRQCDWVTCHQRFQSNDGRLPAFVKPELKADHPSWAPSAWLVRKATLESLNGFDETYRFGSDLDLLRRYRVLNQETESCDETLLIKHFTGENETMDVKGNVKDMLAIIHQQLKSKRS